jgi:hypothetical protein
MLLLTTKFLDVAKFTTLNPLSLLISCELSFPNFVLKMPSRPTFALQSPKKFSCRTYEIDQIHVPRSSQKLSFTLSLL